ncbi:MAG: glycosyltransferase family 2 protein [Chlamydiota bacterium]
MSSPRISIIVLNWNGKKDTLECLRSLQCVPTPHQLIVVDNGSSDDSAVAIRSTYPQTKLLETGKNLGYAEGCNVGIRFALKKQADFLLILNNDTIVDPGILNHFLAAYTRYPFSILSGTPYLYSDPTTLDHLGGRWNPTAGEFDLIGWRARSFNKAVCSLDYGCGCALFSSAEVFHAVGEFDARFFLFWEEADWCFRAKRQGIQVLSCPEATLQHKASASFRRRNHYADYFWWRNRLLWIEKNCSRKAQACLAFSVITPAVWRLIRHAFLTSLRALLAKKSRAHKRPTIEQQKKRYRAALTGIKDYCCRRFYNAPRHLR